MLFVLAQVATSAEVQAARADLRTFIWWAAFIFGASCLFYGFNRTWAAVTSFWAKLQEDLRLRPAATTAEAADRSMRTAAESQSEARSSNRTPPRQPAGYDSAAQTLLQQIAADSSVKSTVMTVEKSDGVYELKFTAATK